MFHSLFSGDVLLVGQRSFFELSVLDYENDLTGSSATDQNLLWVAIRSGWQQHQSTATAAILRAGEIKTLYDWLQGLLLNGRSATRLGFSIPGLGFECLSADSNEFLLQVKLAHEIAPDWRNTPFMPFWLPVVITRSRLTEAVNQLGAQMRKFPVR